MDLLPGTRVMMLSAATEEDAAIEAIAAGATGYLQKYSRPRSCCRLSWTWPKESGMATTGRAVSQAFPTMWWRLSC